MNHRMFQSACAIVAIQWGLVMHPPLLAQEFESKTFELRVYHVNEGERQRFHELMASPGISYLSKHRMTLLGAWDPIDPSDQRVMCLIAHEDAASVNANWKSMASDVAWSAERRYKESDSPIALAPLNERTGAIEDRSHEIHTISIRRSLKPLPIVRTVDQLILEKTPFSPEVQSCHRGNRVFELRSNIAKPGRLPALHARFRNHASRLLSKYDVDQVGYWNVHPDDPHSANSLLRMISPIAKHEKRTSRSSGTPLHQTALLYLMAHPTLEQAERSQQDFRKDSEWAQAYAHSEQIAGGPLTEPNGITSWYLKPTDYSPIH